ncbi:MAG: hypothetical protein HKN45_01280 [Flavobacteriales bacterium]|nr:hypothetical protein [Flavobacteriales bacterium]
MSDKHHISEDELAKQAPILFGLPKQKKIVAPAGYFESLSERVLQKVKSKDQAELYDIQEGAKPSALLWAVAAGIAVLVGLFLINGDYSSSSTTDYFTDLSIDLDLDLEYLMEFEEDIILETYLAEEIGENDTEDIQFLMDEDFDYEDYINVDL